MYIYIDIYIYIIPYVAYRFMLCNDQTSHTTLLCFIGLSFLFIEMKELCEARAKLEMSSNLADEPTLADVLPPIQNCLMKKWQLHVFWNSQLIRKYKEILVYIRIQIPKADGPPPFETARALNELYAFQCCQWEPIRSSQLIRKYKEIPVYIRIQIPKADGPLPPHPQLKLPEL